MGTVWNIAHQARAKLMAVSGHERLRTEATRHHIRNVVSAIFSTLGLQIGHTVAPAQPYGQFCGALHDVTCAKPANWCTDYASTNGAITDAVARSFR